MRLADPNQWTLITWIFAVGFSLFGGIVNYFVRIKKEPLKIFDLLELAGETFTGGFVGLMCFIYAAYLGNPLAICIIAAGAGSYLSAKILFYADKVAAKRLEDKFGIKKDDLS